MINRSPDFHKNMMMLKDKIIADMRMKKRIENIFSRKNQYINEDKNKKTNKFNKSLIRLEKSIMLNNEQENSFIEANELPNILLASNLNSNRSLQGKENKINRHSRNKSLVDNMIDSRRNVSILKNEMIEEENVKFGERLSRVRSPIKNYKLEEFGKINREYLKINKKIEDLDSFTRKVVKSFKLPPIAYDSINNFEYKKFLLK